jgi:adenosylcobinamide-phosphate synthase
LAWIALVATLLFEQVRPLRPGNAVHRAVASLADATARNLNAGHRRHGAYAWLLLVGGATLAGLVVFLLALYYAHAAAALAVDAIVLYATLGFRQFSHYFTAIKASLASGNLVSARALLAEWKDLSGAAPDNPGGVELDQTEIVRQSIETGLLLSHWRVFGVLFWFLLLPGPSGPILYRMAQVAAQRWNPAPEAAAALPADHFGDFARRAFALIDWLPARLTAFGFAIAGDFEGAVYCWRRLPAPRFGADGVPLLEARVVILAAASGALGCRVLPAQELARLFAKDAGPDGAGLAEPDAGSLRSAVGLVWRALVLWLLALLLLSVAAWLG